MSLRKAIGHFLDYQSLNTGKKAVKNYRLFPVKVEARFSRQQMAALLARRARGRKRRRYQI